MTWNVYEKVSRVVFLLALIVVSLDVLLWRNDENVDKSTSTASETKTRSVLKNKYLSSNKEKDNRR